MCNDVGKWLRDIMKTVFAGLPAEPQETDVTAALQQLSLRQKQRQYSATVSSNVLTGSSVKGSGDASTRAVAADSESDDGENVEPRRPPRQSSVDRTFRRASSASRYASDENINGSHDQARTATQQQQQPNSDYFDSQRNMIEQSRALLEQSKAKHHALVAQAHRMQKRLHGGRSIATTSCTFTSTAYDPLTSSQPAIVPKPPSAPNRKTTSIRTQRIARLLF
jgi:hypothetical protein